MGNYCLPFLSIFRTQADYRSDDLKGANKCSFLYGCSFHEMGVYDLPAIIDFVAKTTGQAGRIVYIGHSMGTTMSYIYASLMPDHAKQNLRGIVSLAPIAYLRHVRSAAKLIVPFADIIGVSVPDAIASHNSTVQIRLVRRMHYITQNLTLIAPISDPPLNYRITAYY